jgi:hypothetical protein
MYGIVWLKWIHALAFSCLVWVLCRALITMFKLTCGDSWVDELPSTNEDGSTNYGVALFIMSYIVVAVWTILQVSKSTFDLQKCVLMA